MDRQIRVFVAILVVMGIAVEVYLLWSGLFTDALRTFPQLFLYVAVVYAFQAVWEVARSRYIPPTRVLNPTKKWIIAADITLFVMFIVLWSAQEMNIPFVLGIFVIVDFVAALTVFESLPRGRRGFPTTSR